MSKGQKLSGSDLVQLYEATAHPETRRQMEALEQLRLSWQADRDALDKELTSQKESFAYEAHEAMVILVRLLKDGLYFVIAWFVLWGIQWATTRWPIHGRLAEVFHTMHEMLVVSVFGILAIAVVWDTIEVRLVRLLRRRRP